VGENSRRPPGKLTQRGLHFPADDIHVRVQGAIATKGGVGAQQSRPIAPNVLSKVGMSLLKADIYATKGKKTSPSMCAAKGMLVRERGAESGERGAGIGERGFAILDLF